MNNLHDITLLELEARSIKRIVKKTLFYIIQFSHFIASKYKTLAFFLLVGGLLGFMQFKLEKPQYESRIILTPVKFGIPILCEITNNLDYIIKQNDYNSLAEQLQLPLKIVGKVSSIKASEKFEIDTTGNGLIKTPLNRFVIVIISSDKKNLQIINTKTIQYLYRNLSITANTPVPELNTTLKLINIVIVKLSSKSCLDYLISYLSKAFILGILFIIYRWLVVNKTTKNA